MAMNFANKEGGGPRGKPADDEEDRSAAILFSALGAGLFAIAAGAFWCFGWPSSGNDGQFASKADPICQRIWKSPGWNNDALACYMVEYPSRFCDPGERRHFVAVLKRYRSDIDQAKAKAIKDVTFGSGEIFKDIQKEIDNQERGRTRPKAKPRAKNKYLRNRSIEEDVAAFQEKVFNSSLIGHDAELSALLRGVLEKGYFEPSEFGWFKDEIVSDALSAPLPEVKAPCKDRNS